MKYALLILFQISFLYPFAQQRLPVIKANSKNAFTVEGNEERKDWTLSPQARPDVYTLTKSTKVTHFKFFTDLDSLHINLKPGQTFDFIVLLGQKDSCFTRIESPALKNYSKLKPQIHDTIPFLLTMYNNLVLKVVLDNKDTLNLKFDSGTTDFLLTNDVIKNKLHLDNLNDHAFQIGSQKWEKQSIIAVELSGQGTQGRFGWNLFDGKIVEIDYDRSLFIIHSKLLQINKSYENFTIEYIDGRLCLVAELQIKNKTYKNRFLFDTGYQRTIMLDNELMEEQNYPKDSLKVLKKVIMHNGQGKEIPVLIVNNEKLNLGKFTLKNIPVQLLSTNNPANFKTHILGNEVLKRFNTIIDFQKNMIYLKPDNLIDIVYFDLKQN